MNGNELNQQSTLSWLALFASTGTLICCALPILLVSLGFGAVVAALTSNFPILITLAEYEPWMFVISGVLLSVVAWVIWKRPQLCPSDPQLAQRCARSRVWNRRIFWTATSIWLIGFTAAFLLLPIRNFIGL